MKTNKSTNKSFRYILNACPKEKITLHLIYNIPEKKRFLFVNLFLDYKNSTKRNFEQL